MEERRPYRVIAVAGTRPNFMKVGPLVRAFEAQAGVDLKLVHTGQHYDAAMSQVFFRDLGLPEPDLNLGVGSASAPEQTARILVAFESVVVEWKPDLVVVVGDVTSTLACALAAAQVGVPVAHVEAGLRSFDPSMPEERNRILTDHISDLLFTTEQSGNDNLAREGIAGDRIRFVGNVMIDSLLSVRGRARSDRPWARWDLEPGSYILTTLHRPSNVDIDDRLLTLIAALRTASESTPVVFPVHPRTRDRLEELGAADPDSEHFHLVEPIGYVDFVGLMSAAALVVTDSGGIQEETTVLNVPCLTVRPNTERPVTVQVGTNRLVLPHEPLGPAIQDALARDNTSSSVPPLWDGKAAVRIVADVVEFLESRVTPGA